MTSTSLLAISAADYPCWARAATGVVLAVIAWGGFVGLRTAVRQYRDGRATTANVTGGLVVVAVVVAVVGFWVALGAVL